MTTSKEVITAIRAMSPSTDPIEGLTESIRHKQRRRARLHARLAEELELAAKRLVAASKDAKSKASDVDGDGPSISMGRIRGAMDATSSTVLEIRELDIELKAMDLAMAIVEESLG